MTRIEARTVLVVVFALLAAERVAELVINRRNIAWLRSQGARFTSDDGFEMIHVAVQVLLFVLVPAEVWFAPWAGVGWWTWPLLALAVGAQLVRYWVIATLGRRWCVRVVTLPGTPRIAGGPYRFMSHPNYAVVLAETVLYPMMFASWVSLLLLVPLNVVALRRRIAREETALRAAEPASGPRS